MKITKNFLNKDLFKKISNTLIENNFPWFIQFGVNKIKDGNIQFTHLFYQDTANSTYFTMLEPILYKLNIKKLHRIKANLILKTKKIIEHGYHTDYEDLNIAKNCNTAILYMNTNNGYTKFKNKKIIKSESNKFISFNSNMLHTGSTCTDNDIRLVINFNYESK
jgi:hypothetical protein